MNIHLQIVMTHINGSEKRCVIVGGTKAIGICYVRFQN